ncbi:MAG: hypothetical protein J7K85_01840 [Anaerolineaceae bacterium]|nr:hypothetical protein [Anaerolineaceae bacterium]
MKLCPYCAEEIQDQAIYCHYCNQELLESTLQITWSGPFPKFFFVAQNILIDGKVLGTVTYLSTNEFLITAGEHIIQMSFGQPRKLIIVPGQTIDLTFGARYLFPFFQLLAFLFNRLYSFPFYPQKNWQHTMNRDGIGYGFFKFIEVIRMLFCWAVSCLIFFTAFIDPLNDSSELIVLIIGGLGYGILAVGHTVILSKSGNNNSITSNIKAITPSAPQAEVLPTSPPPSPSYDTSSVVPASHLKDDPPLPQVSNKPNNTILWIVLIVLIGAIFLIAAVILIPLLAPLLPTPNHSYISPTTAKTFMPTHTKAPAARNPAYTPKPDSWYMEIGEIQKTELPLAQEWYSGTQNQCLHWDQVGLQHVGQTLCVYGTVRKAWIDREQDTFFMTFGTEPGDFYMLTYGGWYFLDIQNSCQQSEGEIMQIGSAPVMVVDPGKLFECD